MTSIDLQEFLGAARTDDRHAIFGLLALGVTESIASGLLSASESVRTFFTAGNSLFVKRALKDRDANEIMRRGVQLPDLFDALDPDEAAKELRNELRTIRDLCQDLLHRTPAAP